MVTFVIRSLCDYAVRITNYTLSIHIINHVSAIVWGSKGLKGSHKVGYTDIRTLGLMVPVAWLCFWLNPEKQTDLTQKKCSCSPVNFPFYLIMMQSQDANVQGCGQRIRRNQHSSEVFSFAFLNTFTLVVHASSHNNDNTKKRRVPRYLKVDVKYLIHFL